MSTPLYKGNKMKSLLLVLLLSCSCFASLAGGIRPASIYEVSPHLMQSDTTDQAIVNVTLAQAVTFDTDNHHSGFTRTSSRFTITKAGSYLITFSGMGVGVQGKVLQFWLKKNADYVANSNTQYTFKGTGTNAVIACSFIEHFEVGDYFEFWTWGDDVGCKWDAIAAGTNPTRPAIPSIIITANYTGRD